MKMFVTAVMALAFGLAVVSPAAAAGMAMCPHEATVQSLEACVEHAKANGYIDNQGISRSLLGKLDAAATAIERGQPEVASNILESVVNQLEAQDGKHIAAPHAGHLQDHAQMVIDALSE